MRKFIFLSLAFLSFSAQCQDCNFKTNEVDAFTKAHKIETKEQVIATTSSSAVYFSFFKNSDTYLNLRYSSSGLKSIVVGYSDKLSLLLKNDELIELKPVKVYSSKFNSLNGTDLDCMYLVSPEEIAKIKNSGIDKIRIYSTQVYFDFNVTKEKWVKKLNKNIDCFLAGLQ